MLSHSGRSGYVAGNGSHCIIGGLGFSVKDFNKPTRPLLHLELGHCSCFGLDLL